MNKQQLQEQQQQQQQNIKPNPTGFVDYKYNYDIITTSFYS